MNGHDIKVLNERLARCSRCGLTFRTDFILRQVPGTTQEYEACSPERRAAYAAAVKCRRCSAVLDEMEHHEGYQWKVCPDCGAAHRLIATVGPLPGKNFVVDEVFPSAPWKASR